MNRHTFRYNNHKDWQLTELFHEKLMNLLIGWEELGGSKKNIFDYNHYCNL